MRHAADRVHELEALDLAVYGAIAGVSTPQLHRDLARLSRAADGSKLWFAASGLLAGIAGARGRRAAVVGLRSIAVTSAVVNLALKPLGGRRRPDLGSSSVARGSARQISSPLDMLELPVGGNFAVAGLMAAGCEALACLSRRATGPRMEGAGRNPAGPVLRRRGVAVEGDAQRAAAQVLAQQAAS